jgi:CBS-domain-containing membrane protein
MQLASFAVMWHSLQRVSEHCHSECIPEFPRILAAALSLSAKGALMVLLDVSPPPAGATSLIVSLGIISKPRELVIFEVAVFLLVAQALAINRLVGLRYPFWSPLPQPER